MPFTDLTPAPAAPTRSMEPEDFIDAADAFVAWLATFEDEINAFQSELEAAAALIAAAPSYADTALKVIADSGLTPAANRMIYYTSASVAALTAVTSAGLALLSAADAAAQRTALSVSQSSDTLLKADNLSGIGNAATARSNIGAAASGANTDITALDQDVTITETGTIAANTIGYRGIPSNSKTAAYELALADAGELISITTGGITIPANASVAFPIGTTIVIYNDSASAQNVAITTDTLRLGGTTTTGTLSLAARGLATLIKVNTTEWVATGHIG